MHVSLQLFNISFVIQCEVTKPLLLLSCKTNLRISILPRGSINSPELICHLVNATSGRYSNFEVRQTANVSSKNWAAFQVRRTSITLLAMDIVYLIFCNESVVGSMGSDNIDLKLTTTGSYSCRVLLSNSGHSRVHLEYFQHRVF